MDLIELYAPSFDGYTIKEHIELYADDLNIENTASCEIVKPSNRSIENETGALLKKHSWNMLVLKK